MEQPDADSAQPAAFGKYQVLRSLGKGSNGTVFLALDSDLERQVAVKSMNLSRKDVVKGFKRFHLEAKALAKLNSPHIVYLFEYCLTPSNAYLVMEYVEGQSLQAEIAKGAVKGFRQLLDCAWQTLSGLADAHDVHIIHRDIKPANILLSKDGVYKLADFGLARELKSQVNLTGAGLVVGTVRYMAPEVAMGQAATIRSDLYSLGATIYELSCGKPLLTGNGIGKVASQIVSAHRSLLGSERPDLPQSFVRWIERMVERNPEQRFTSAREALSALGEVSLPLPAIHAPVFMSRHAEVEPAAISNHKIPALPDATGRRRRRRVPYSVKILLAAWGITCAASLAISFAIYSDASARLEQSRRDKLTSLAAAIAVQIDGAEHARLAAIAMQTDGAANAWLATTSHEDNPDFQSVRSLLRRHMTANPEIVDVYTLTKSVRKGILLFVVDTMEVKDRNGNGMFEQNEKPACLGEAYNPSFIGANAMLEAFEHPAADSDVATDQWGATLSAYAPIRGSGGETVGIVGVDISGESVREARRFFLLCCAAIIGATLLMALAAAFLAARSLALPLSQLTAGVQAAAKGDLTHVASSARNDEFEDTTEALNTMIAGLRERDALRNAQERHIIGQIADHLHSRIGGQVKSALIPGRITYLYIDISSAYLTAHESCADFLGSAFPAVIRPILSNGGMVDGVLGNGIVAIFGVVFEEQQEELAIRAALATHEAIVHLHADLHLPATFDGMGVCTRKMGVDSGHTQRDEHVRLAQALSNMAKQIDQPLLVSESSFASVRHIFIAERFEVRLPESIEPTAAYAIRGVVSG